MSFFRPPFVRCALLASAAAAAAGAPLIAASPASTPVADVATSAPAVSGFDAALVRDINHARASRGMRPVALVAGGADVAHRWSGHLTRYRTLPHNPDLTSDL